MTNLPDKAAKKFMELRHQADDYQALIASSLGRASELRRALQNNPTGPEAPNWKFEIDRLEAHVTALQAKAGNASQLLATLAYWKTTLRPDQKLVEARPLKMPLLDGDTHVAAVHRVRQQISSLGAELHAVNHAGPTKDEQYEAAHNYVDALLAKTKPAVKATHGKFEVSFASDASHTPKANVAAALCWLSPPLFLQNLIDAVDALPTPRLVMTASAKAERIAQIRDEMLRHERIEEWLITEAGEDEVVIPRRPLASPLAILGLAIVVASKEAAAA